MRVHNRFRTVPAVHVLTESMRVHNRFRTVPAVHVSARLPLPHEGPGAESQYGHNCRGLPVVDVEGTELFTSLPLHRLLLGVVSCIHSLQPHIQPHCGLACKLRFLNVANLCFSVVQIVELYAIF